MCSCWRALIVAGLGFLGCLGMGVGLECSVRLILPVLPGPVGTPRQSRIKGYLPGGKRALRRTVARTEVPTASRWASPMAL